MAGYVRQSTLDIQPDKSIKAEPFNAEFDALAGAFNQTSGHNHNGTAGNGPKLDINASTTGILPANRVDIQPPDLSSYVVGPASAVDNALVAFNGATGKLVKSSGNTVTGLLSRANHTGTQAISTVSGLQAALDGKATSAQGAKADTAVQPSAITDFVKGPASSLDGVIATFDGTTGKLIKSSTDSLSFVKNRANHTGTQPASTITGLSTVATSGSYNDLSNKPALGTASAKNIEDFPTLAQGAKADSALQNLVSGDNISIQGSGTSRTIHATVPVASVAGKTGAVTLAKADVGLGNVDNTSDANKPVSTAQQTALNLKLDATAKAADSSLLNGQTAAQLPISTATQTALNGKAGFSTQTSVTQTTFPVGQTLIAWALSVGPDLRGTSPVRRHDNSYYYLGTGSNQLAGTWVSTGFWTARETGFYFSMQRIL